MVWDEPVEINGIGFTILEGAEMALFHDRET